MSIRSQILDEDSGDYVKGVSVVVTDTAGKNLITPVTTDAEGHFELPESLFTDSTGKKIKIYGTGIETMIMNAGLLGPYAIKVKSTGVNSSGLGENLLDRKELPSVNYAVPIILAGLSVICLTIGLVSKT